MTISQICPCRVLTPDFAVPYSDCCAPLHMGTQLAQTAEQLMRSRYSAFVLTRDDIKLADYIVVTTLPAQQALLDKAAIKDWAMTTHWAGLEIIGSWAKVGKRHAQVEFKAYFDLADDDLSIGKTQEHQAHQAHQAHHERSTFVKVQEKWYFLDPTVSMNVTQKQPCICGSGEKFKRCCRRYV